MTEQHKKLNRFVNSMEHPLIKAEFKGTEKVISIKWQALSIVYRREKEEAIYGNQN